MLLNHGLPVHISEERMLLDLSRATLLLQAESSVWQLVCQSLEQVFKLLAEVILCRHIAKSNIVRHGVKVRALERRLASRQLVHDDAQRPPVRLHVVSLLRYDLRRHILRCTAY